MMFIEHPPRAKFPGDKEVHLASALPSRSIQSSQLPQTGGRTAHLARSSPSCLNTDFFNDARSLPKTCHWSQCLGHHGFLWHIAQFNDPPISSIFLPPVPQSLTQACWTGDGEGGLPISHKCSVKPQEMLGT